MFSPLIGACSTELLRALAAVVLRIVDAARGKLRCHRMSDARISKIVRCRELARNLKVRASPAGMVIAFEAGDGPSLQPGTHAAWRTGSRAVWLIVIVFEHDTAG